MDPMQNKAKSPINHKLVAWKEKQEHMFDFNISLTLVIGRSNAFPLGPMRLKCTSYTGCFRSFSWMPKHFGVAPNANFWSFLLLLSVSLYRMRAFIHFSRVRLNIPLVCVEHVWYGRTSFQPRSKQRRLDVICICFVAFLHAHCLFAYIYMKITYCGNWISHYNKHWIAFFSILDP